MYQYFSCNGRSLGALEEAVKLGVAGTPPRLCNEKLSDMGDWQLEAVRHVNTAKFAVT